MDCNNIYWLIFNRNLIHVSSNLVLNFIFLLSPHQWCYFQFHVHYFRVVLSQVGHGVRKNILYACSRMFLRTPLFPSPSVHPRSPVDDGGSYSNQCQKFMLNFWKLALRSQPSFLNPEFYVYIFIKCKTILKTCITTGQSSVNTQQSVEDITAATEVFTNTG